MLHSVIPFQLKEYMVWISANVNGHQLSGILDSDSDETYLDDKTGQRLTSIKPREHFGNVPGDAVEDIQSMPVSFDLGPSTVLTSQKPKIIEIENRYPGMHFILGFDAIGKTPFTLDYSKNLIQLGTIPQGPTVAFPSKSELPSLSIKISNIQVNSVVDTGSPAGLDLPFGWVKSNLPAARFQEAVGRRDLGPRFAAHPFSLREIQIGSVKLSNVKAEAIQDKTHPRGQPDEWATIGNRILSGFAQVGIDGPGRKCVFIS